MATLTTTATHDGDRIVLVCTGSAETDSVDSLQAALDDAHSSAMTRAARTIVADLRGLEFATSSCLKVFVSWLQRVQKLDGDACYKVVFRSTPQHSWQRRSLGALAAFARDIVSVESEAS